MAVLLATTWRDDQGRVWYPEAGGRFGTADGRHHQTLRELHDRTDLVQVSS
jgi:hypothetical protein